MKAFKIMLAAMLAAVSVLYGLFSVRQSLSGKDEGPAIACASDTVEISVTDDESALLAGVTASDKQDGDLTNQVRVLSVSKFTTPGTAKITYVVFDKDHNMATATRQLHYSDYTSPVFSIDEPLIYAQNASIELLDRLTVTDVLDGDITQSIRVSSMRSTSDPEVYTVDIQATNSLGDTSRITLPIIRQESSLNRARVQLKSYLLYLDSGSTFRGSDYLAGVSTAQGFGSLNNVEISGTVDTSTPGTYMVYYQYRDESCTGTAILTVVVR